MNEIYVESTHFGIIIYIVYLESCVCHYETS